MEVLDLIADRYREELQHTFRRVRNSEAVLYKLLKNNPINIVEMSRYIDQLKVPIDEYIEALVYFDTYLEKMKQTASLTQQHGYLSCCIEANYGAGRLSCLLKTMLMEYGLE